MLYMQELQQTYCIVNVFQTRVVQNLVEEVGFVLM